LIAPAAGAELSGGLTLSAEASDESGVAGVQFQVDGVNIGTEDTAPPFAVEWNTLHVADGVHTLTAKARDARGNTATSAPVSVTVKNAIFDTFEGGGASWSSDGTGTWAVAEQDGNHVFRQSDSTAVANRAVLESEDWADQVVEADVTFNAATGANRFFGVVARYRTPGDYYYFVLRTNNTAELKRLTKGVATSLTPPVALPFTVTPGVTHRMTLEVIGARLRAYLDGQLLMEGADADYATGRVALLTYFSDVSFDNVHAAPTALAGNGE
jgi:hypothetical protein